MNAYRLVQAKSQIFQMKHLYAFTWVETISNSPDAPHLAFANLVYIWLIAKS